MKKIFDYALMRLRERSTWLGLVSLLTALGIVLTSAQQEYVIAAGSALAGLIATLTPDKS